METLESNDQTAPRYAIPLNEAKAIEWIESLSLTDVGDTSRRIFYGLTDLNRRVVPPLLRMTIGEKLLPVIEVLVGNLHRHLTYHDLPLPDRSGRILELNQTILLEYAGLFQMAAVEMLARGPVKRQPFQLAIYRVIDTLGIYLLNTYTVFTRVRETVWHDINHMFLLASENGLTTNTILLSNGIKATIEQRFIECNMLALFKPFSLRPEEIIRISRYLKSRTHLITISQGLETSERIGDIAHVVMMNHDEPAVIMPASDLPHSPTVRVLNIRKLIKDMDEMIEEESGSSTAASVLHKGGLSRSLIKRMIFHVTTIQNRGSVRFEKSEKVPMVVSLKQVLSLLSEEGEISNLSKADEDALFNSFGTTQDIDEHEAEHKIRLWDLINSSVGGYGLHWPHAEMANVRVGELVAIRSGEAPWNIGVIKWIEIRDGEGLFCGVESLASEVSAVTVNKVHNREFKLPLPEKGLLVEPSMDGEKSVFILPSYTFQPGDVVDIKMGEESKTVALTNMDDCLGSFAYVNFDNRTNVDVQRKGAQFDDLWESL